MDPSSKYTNQDELPSVADNNNAFLNNHHAGYNALYSTGNVPTFGAPWDLDSFQDPQQQSTVYQHAEPGWQPTPMNAPNSTQVSSFGIPSSNYALPYAASAAAFDFPTFNQQTGQPFSTASYDTSLNYGHGPLLTERNFETPTIADFGPTSTQSGTVSPQVLQGYPNAYGTGLGLSPDFQVHIIIPQGHIGGLWAIAGSTSTAQWQLGSGKSFSRPTAAGISSWQNADANRSL